MRKNPTGPADPGDPVEDPGLPAAEQGLLPVLPMLYIAWADRVLTPSEIRTIRDRLRAQKWLKESERELLDSWLDPAHPPAARQLQHWLSTIRSSADKIPQRSKRSLVDLGVEVARIGARHAVERPTSQEAYRALQEIEEALGVVSKEATREVLYGGVHRPEPSPEPSQPSFNVEAMTRLLDGEHAEIRKKVRILLRDPVFRYEYGIDTGAYREKVYAWCRQLAQQGLGAISYPTECGGEDDLPKFIAVFETLAYHDLSLLIKFGVQFGLFGGAILNLGTRPHHQDYLPRVSSLELPGCFAMTELGHGSNVSDIETLARFDRSSGEFILHTPSDGARKDYIGNAAQHGRMAVVFAQLELDGEAYGLHAFLVPIRSDEGRPLPHVRIEDCGDKMGLNGVDNGRIWLDHVRIPRENLLNRFGDVSAQGEYSSPISSPSKRFFTMLGTLIGGRMSLTVAALSVAKSALTIAIRYAVRRRQFGPPGEAETLLLDYRMHQRRLLPLLADAYALDFASKYLIRRFAGRSEEDEREIEGLAAGLKAYSTWNTTKTIQVCRECCGGQGYFSLNRIPSLKADTDVFTTFEGDNTVLMQLVARGRLSEFREQVDEIKFFGLVKYIGKQAAAAISELNPVITRRSDEEHLRNGEYHLSAFQYRENELLVSVARRLKKRIDAGMDSFEAFNECQDHLISLSFAYIERVIMQQFLETIEKCADPGLSRSLKRLSELFALSRMERHRGWFLEQGYIEGTKAKAIRAQVNRLCSELRPEAVHLVDAFAIPDESLAAPIALSAEAGSDPLRSSENDLARE